MFLFFVVGFVSSILPFYSDKVLGRCTNNVEKWMSLANTFGGGVLLAVGVMDLLNDSVVDLAEINAVYPMSCSLAVLSYLILLGFESLIFPHSHRTTPVEMAIPTTPGLNEQLISIKKSGNPSKAYLLALSLTFHTVLEGIALGILSSLTTVVNVFLGIIFHKFAAGLALGIYCHREELTKCQAMPVVISFSIAAPIGVGIGMGIQSMSGDIVIGCFLALAAGTFIYISTTEIVSEELKGKRVPWKYFTFVLGVLTFGGIIGITVAFTGGED
jgi:zinc transporter 1/2/3